MTAAKQHLVVHHFSAAPRCSLLAVLACNANRAYGRTALLRKHPSQCAPQASCLALILAFAKACDPFPAPHGGLVCKRRLQRQRNDTCAIAAMHGVAFNIVNCAIETCHRLLKSKLDAYLCCEGSKVISSPRFLAPALGMKCFAVGSWAASGSNASALMSCGAFSRMAEAGLPLTRSQ